MASFDEVVPPGKAGSIKTSVHTISYKGQIAKQITVNHDDKSQGPIQLNINATIVGSVEVLPYPSLQLARKRKGFGTPAQIIVRKDTTEQGALAFGGLSASAKWLKATFREVKSDEPPNDTIPAAKAGDIVVSVLADPDTPVGNHSENISFTTGLKREPKVTIPVTAYVQGPVTLQPTDLVLNEASDGTETASGVVLAALRDDIDAKSLTVKSDSSAFTVRLDPSGAQAFRLLVDWSGKGKNPPKSTVIHVRAGKDAVDLPVHVAPR